MQIIKRDGRTVEFEKEKVIAAIQKAFLSVDGDVSEYAQSKAENIASYIQEYGEKAEHKLTVEEIQDLVEKGLMACKRKEIAKEYILYREERNRARLSKIEMMKKIREKLFAVDPQNQNANVDEQSFGGRKGEADAVLCKEMALNEMVSKMSRENHLNNQIYIHDLDSYIIGSHNCLSVPFDDLLTGFNTRQTDVRGANSVNTAFQLVAVLFQLQSLQQFGGVSATHLDWTMVPYVRKSFAKHYVAGLKYLYKINTSAEDKKTLYKVSIEDKDIYDKAEAYEYAMDMTINECAQAVEGMFHNLNTLQSRSGNQLPFTSINFGTCTLPEGRMIIKAILEGGIKGVGQFHKTSVFPCTIFQCMKGINRKPGDPNYDLFKLALKSTAQRLYPNYANVDWSGNAGYDPSDPRTYFSTMGLA